MTSNEQGDISTSHEIDNNNSLQEANLIPTSTNEMSCTLSIEIGIPLANTVFASSIEKKRKVKVDPVRIKRSLESLRKNKQLQIKGLG